MNLHVAVNMNIQCFSKSVNDNIYFVMFCFSLNSCLAKGVHSSS